MGLDLLDNRGIPKGGKKKRCLGQSTINSGHAVKMESFHNTETFISSHQEGDSAGNKAQDLIVKEYKEAWINYPGKTHMQGPENYGP